MVNIRKGVLDMFIELKKDSNIDSPVVRLDNKKLNKFKMIFI